MAHTISWDKIKVLSFDIYGTLIDWENGIANAARATSLGHLLPTDHKQLMLDIEKQDTTVQREHPDMRQSDVIAEGFRRYVGTLGLVQNGSVNEAQVDQAAKEYGASIGQYPAFDDTVEAIQRLGKRFKLVPLSNVDITSFKETLSGPLKGCKFDAVYTAQDIGSYKPDPRNFQYLLDHVKHDFDCEKDQLVHVAQSLFHDHGPASTFGIQGVWVDRKGFMGGEVGEGNQSKYGYQLKVDTLGELAKIIEQTFA